MFCFWNLYFFMWLWCFWSGIFTPSWMLWMKSYVWNHVYVDFFIWLGLIYSYWWKTTWAKKKRRKKEEEENKIIPQTEEGPFMNWTLKWYKIIWTESGRNLESELSTNILYKLWCLVLWIFYITTSVNPVFNHLFCLCMCLS